MTEATITSPYPIKIGSLGMYSVLLWKHSDVDDTETITTGLGTRIAGVWVSWIGNPSSQTSGGGHFDYSATTGIITLYPSSDNLSAETYVLVSGN